MLQLNRPGQSTRPNLPEGALLTRTPGVWMRRRGERVLFIEPESASWIVLEEPYLSFWQKMSRPMTWAEAKTLDHPLEAEKRHDFLVHMYGLDMVRVNGRAFFNTPEVWKPPQRYPTYLCLHLTESCNFGCHYCMADSYPHKGKMPMETAKLIIEKVLHELPPNNLTIDFHGGEPLLAWDELLETVDHAKVVNERDGLNKKLWFMLQTNGSLLTPDKVAKMKELGMIVGVSMDGPPEIHDRHRVFAGSEKGTFDTVLENVRMAEEMGYPVGLLSVIHEPKEYLTTFRFMLHEMKRKTMRINYSSYIGRSPYKLQFPVDRAEEFGYAWLEMIDEALAWCRENNESLQIADVNNQINNIVSKNRPFMCYRSPCGVGNSVLGFGIDGGIHACEEMASLDMFRVANIHDEGLNLARMVEDNPVLKLLQSRTVDNIPKCSQCHLKRICYGGCTSKTMARFGDAMRESPMCGYYLVVFEELMWRIHDNPDLVQRLGFPGTRYHAWPPPESAPQEMPQLRVLN